MLSAQREMALGPCPVPLLYNFYRSQALDLKALLGGREQCLNIGCLHVLPCGSLPGLLVTLPALLLTDPRVLWMLDPRVGEAACGAQRAQTPNQNRNKTEARTVVWLTVYMSCVTSMHVLFFLSINFLCINTC